MMKLPAPGPVYDARNEAATREQVEREDGRNRKTDNDIHLASAAGLGLARLILHAPDGSQWWLKVDNSGNLTAAAFP